MNQVVKINIIINKNPYFENSASGNRWLTLIEGLSNLGVEIQLLITNGYNSKDEYKRLRNEGQIKKIKYRYLISLFHSTIWLKRINNYILTPLIRPIVYQKILKIITHDLGSIVWTDSTLESFRLVVRLKKQFPEIKTFLELSEFLDIYKYNKGRLVHKIEGSKMQNFFEKKAFYAYDGLALMTKTLLNHYKNFPQPGPKLLHLPMTVDLDRFTQLLNTGIEFKKPYIVFVGVMNNAKEGVDILIKAFNKIKNEFTEVNLYLIGPWHYDTPGHISLIREYELQNRVFWKGECERERIPSILMNADLLVLPRPDSKQARGGFPTKLGEYLAAGVPICATRVGEIPDYLTDNESVFFAEPDSVESFANAMRNALSNPEKARQIGLNGRKIAEKYFNKDMQSKILLDFLKTLIKS